MTKAEKELVRAEYEKEWSSPKMVNYCTAQADVLVTLTDGGFFVIDKETIKTEFCFGYSDSSTDNESYEKANEKAREAGESAEYFRNKNLEHFKRQIERSNRTDRKHIVVKRYSEESNFVGVNHILPWGIKETYKELSEDDRQAIIEGYEQAIANMNKRIDVYLKKFGLTKLHTWTYWKDE